MLTDDASVDTGGACLLVCDDLAGTTACMAEHFFGNPSQQLHLIGVTGTNGKTTTVHLVQQMLKNAGLKCGLIGTVQIDDGFEVCRGTLTTPMAIDLSRTLSRMVQAGCQCAVMEASSHALHQGRTAGLHFRTALFTNLTGDHLDYHLTMDRYAESKAILFKGLPCKRDGGTAILNAEDPWSERMVRESRAKVVGFGFQHGIGSRAAHCEETLTADVVSMSTRGTRSTWRGCGLDGELTLPLLGMHNVANAMGAALIGRECGLSREQIVEALAKCVAPPGRLEPVLSEADKVEFSVLVDYAHSDDALNNVLRAARSIVPVGGRLVVMFGCGGDRDRTKRPRMAATACGLADVVWITSDNPRTESPDAIIAEVLSGVPAGSGGRVRVEADRLLAIRRVILEEAQSGDVIVLAGKGHEDYQIIGTTKRPFDDRQVAREAIEARLVAGLGNGRHP